MTPENYSTALLTLQLAAATSVILLLLGTPLAWWLARTHSVWRRPVAALIALPLVLPPTVLGFYLLIALGPQGWVGQLTQFLGIGTLTFSFTGLVIASVIYSLPFTVQPLHGAFSQVGRRPLDVAATLGASPLQQFLWVVVPLSRSGFITAGLLTFAHTVGEFGVVLMIGGNITGETRVLSIAIYDHVEAMQYSDAHWLSASLLLFSFAILLLVNSTGRRNKQPHEINLVTANE
ncbi:MAG: molybdate ABC transporter permease subunit [Gammaproteobacteria bacterium]|jgi:molybdate transport system permease protein|nr:molybdate ABC transporter permease subunit [Gammaproteobacteria bacterium]MBQ0774920.1 molybdate ABC transporter permease subunit [Gammaproteobacteria bacterium]